MARHTGQISSTIQSSRSLHTAFSAIGGGGVIIQFQGGGGSFLSSKNYFWAQIRKTLIFFFSKIYYVMSIYRKFLRNELLFYFSWTRPKILFKNTPAPPLEIYWWSILRMYACAGGQLYSTAVRGSLRGGDPLNRPLPILYSLQSSDDRLQTYRDLLLVLVLLLLFDPYNNQALNLQESSLT